MNGKNWSDARTAIDDAIRFINNFEIRSTKFETNYNFLNSNVLNIWKFEFGHCFVFRISIFGFNTFALIRKIK